MKKGEKEGARKKGIWQLFWKQRSLQLFVLAGVVYILIFNYIPMVGLIIGFKDYKITSGLTGMFTSPWVGLKWFREFFGDYKFPQLMRNTLVLSILKLSLHLVKEPLEILTSPKYFTAMAVLTAIWKDTGWWAIIFLAAITGIDPTLYEAAEMDGATRVQRIRYITLPCIAGTVTVVLIMALGNLLGGGLSGSNFEQCYLLGNEGNMEVSDIIQTYVMRIGLSNGRYSFATAVGMFQSVISVVLVFVSNFISKKISGNGLF